MTVSYGYWPITAERWSGAESHKVATWDDFPRSFEEAPIVPAEKPTEPEKNKYVRWDTPMATKVDAEIKRMNVEGKTSQEISEELAKRNIFVTWQRVRGRI